MRLFKLLLKRLNPSASISKGQNVHTDEKLNSLEFKLLRIFEKIASAAGMHVCQNTLSRHCRFVSSEYYVTHMSLA